QALSTSPSFENSSALSRASIAFSARTAASWSRRARRTNASRSSARALAPSHHIEENAPHATNDYGNRGALGGGSGHRYTSRGQGHGRAARGQRRRRAREVL